MNNIPLFYDKLWKKYTIKRYELYFNYEFIKDLSFPNKDIHSVILLFKYNNNYLLRGYRNISGLGDGILFPFFTNTDITKLNNKKRTKNILLIIQYIKDIFKKYNIIDTYIFQYPYYSLKLGHDMFSLFGIKSKSMSDELFVFNGEDILKSLHLTKRQYINKYLDKHTINIYFGEIPDKIYDNFSYKYKQLDKKRPSIWMDDYFKPLIIQKKAFLVEINNNFVFFSISDTLSYYILSACDKKDDITTILIFKSIEFSVKNKCNYIYFGNYYTDFDNIKYQNISKFKYGFCNKLITSYYY